MIGLAMSVCLGSLGAGLAVRELYRRSLDRWIVSYLLSAKHRRVPDRGEKIHVLLCIADHYEPGVGSPPLETARRRVSRWQEEYPRLCAAFRDSDGIPPRHTFFYPLEMYDPWEMDALGTLCQAGLGEVEVHLHHDRDTAEQLREKLTSYKKLLAERHGQLAHHRTTGELAYGFVHGNWALDNSRPDGRHCGVNNELDILRETGCYADFTLPSAPHRTQTRKINRIYYALDDPLRPRSHDWGTDAGTCPPPDNAFLLVQGPLLLDWANRKWGVFPRIENACIQANQPPSAARLDLWLKARIGIPARPDWIFVKLHTHGAAEENLELLLGEPMIRFHQALAGRAAEDPNFQYHYVSAREMFNLVRAAENGWQGSVAEARDYQLLWNGCRQPTPQGAG
jgi:hypothetical protein